MTSFAVDEPVDVGVELRRRERPSAVMELDLERVVER
jgi:hypothetical protein